MRIFSFVFFFLLLSLTTYAQEEEKIISCFAKYKSGILANNGKEAVKQVNQATIDYYANILYKVLYADSSTVEKLRIVDKIAVLRIRMSASPDQLQKLDGREFFVYSVKSGLVNNAEFSNVELGKIRVDGEKAEADFVNKGRPASFPLNFDKEDAGWKFDLTSVLSVSNQSFEAVLEQGGMEEEDFIIRALHGMSVDGENPGKNLWQPLLSKK